MGSWACEFILSVTAPQPIAQPAQPPANQFYFQWSLLGVAIAAMGGLIPATRWFFVSPHRDLQSAILSLEQVASAYFVRIVLTEARRVFAIVDDHLPLTLSQVMTASPQLSRFDHFCKALRQIPAEELNDRGRYANIIKESFGRIISASAGRLLDTMGSGPMTYMLRNPRTGELRASVAKWCERVHPDLGGILTSGRGALRPDQLPDLGEMCENLHTFQIEAVGEGEVDRRAKKYLERYGMTVATKPRCILPPYFKFDAVGDAWYTMTVSAANITAEIAGDDEAAGVIVCDSALLEDEAVERIADDFGVLQRCFVWIDGLSQLAASARDIRRVRRLASALSSRQCSVEALYGGFMMMLMGYDDGMEAISHGILYTEDKPTKSVPGPGGVSERYYIPRFHDFRSLRKCKEITWSFASMTRGTDRVVPLSVKAIR